MNRRNQLQWIVLLAAAVILPTVSLLWFMSRAVANERLVIRQKLAALYEGRLMEAGELAAGRIARQLEELDRREWTQDPYGLLEGLVLEKGFQGVVVWGPDGLPVFPSTGSLPDSNDEMSAPLSEAWNLEFNDKEYAAAAEQYGRLAESGDTRALAGQVRCLVKLNRWEDAFSAATAQQQASSAPVRLLLLTQLRDTIGFGERPEMTIQLARMIAGDLYKSGPDCLPSSQNLLVARRFMEMMQQDIEFPGETAVAARLERLIEAEARSQAVQESFPAPTGAAEKMTAADIGGERLYLLRHTTPFNEIVLALSEDGLMSALASYRAEFSSEEVHVRILDAQGRFIGGESSKSSMTTIAWAPLPTGFPDGRVELYFSGGDLFSKAAERQITIYIWTGVLVILLMLVIGAFAGQAVSRQIRLNSMKNDFIATVSHELKTPLASMRLLVDTLLEGRTRDEAHAEEYLRMIARENERLTRMIDNFLSFSRMERNKNAFSLAPASPAAMVDDAIDSVCTKYRTNQCLLETDLADDLPEVPADHDAIVTVLINLLDNACKYTTDDKRIRLSVAVDNDELCFSVADNGIGMSRRQIRRIFDSFYQADDSLARTAEGCGLGLSIVQFIVSAHKGRIEVESRPGEGSTFTVRLPING